MKYSWMNKFLRSFRWVIERVENGFIVSISGSYEKVMAKLEDPEKTVLKEITAGLQLIFGEYLNPRYMERLENLCFQVDDNDIRMPFKAMDEMERFSNLTDRLDFVVLYAKYRLLQEDLTLDNDPVKLVRTLLHEIRTTEPKDDPLNEDIAERIRTYCRQFAAEYSPYLKDATESDDCFFVLLKSLNKAYNSLLQERREDCAGIGGTYKPGKADEVFSKEISEAGEILQKWYAWLERKNQQDSPLDIHVFNRAIRAAERKAANQSDSKKRGRKVRPAPVLTDEILAETAKNSAMNLMSDAEFEFLRRVSLLRVIEYYDGLCDWADAAGALREEAADALEDFSHDEAILGYLNVDRSRSAEVVEELLNIIRYPLYPMQRKLGDALIAFLDMTQNPAQFTKHCSAGVQFKSQKQLEKIAGRLHVDIGFSRMICSLPEKENGGRKMWLDALIEEQTNAGETGPERRKQIFEYMNQILQLMFGRYLRTECLWRLTESVLEKEDEEVYRRTYEYRLYHAYCSLIREYRAVLETFLDECQRDKYVEKKKMQQIITYFEDIIDFLKAPEFPDADTMDCFREFSKRAASFCKEQHIIALHENAADETLFDGSWSQEILEKYDVFKYHSVYSFQEQRHSLRELLSYFASTDEWMHSMYDFLWECCLGLGDVSQLNWEYMEAQAEQQKKDQPKPEKTEEPDRKDWYNYHFLVFGAEYHFFSLLCSIACRINPDVTCITPDMIAEKEREELVTAVAALAETPGIYYYLEISQTDRNCVRQIAENHFLYPRACRINDIVCRFCRCSQEIGLFDDTADKDLLHQWMYFLYKEADIVQKKYNKWSDGESDLIQESGEKVVEKLRRNSFRTARKSSGNSRRK